MDLNTNENPTRRHLLYSIWTLCWCVYYWFISFIVMKWKKRFDKKFVRDDGLMSKYGNDEGGESSYMADLIKQFITSLLDQQQERMIEEVEKLKLIPGKGWNLDNWQHGFNVALLNDLSILKGNKKL